MMLGGTTFKVSGMTCDHCEESVEKAISAIEGVKGVKANAEKGVVKVKGKLTEEMTEKIKAAIAEAGFTVEE